MDDGDNPEYPHQVFELPGGVRVRRIQVGHGKLVVFEAGGREVSCPARLDDGRLPDGALLRHPGTWFWHIDCEWTPLPYGPYLTREGAEVAARRAVNGLMISDHETL